MPKHAPTASARSPQPEGGAEAVDAVVTAVLTASRRLLAVTARSLAEIARIVAARPAAERTGLVRVLNAFAVAGDESLATPSDPGSGW